jgi:hypothetical protein
MIVIWVIELFLNQLGTLRDKGNDDSAEYVSLQKELDLFLTRPRVTVSFAHLTNGEQFIVPLLSEISSFFLVQADTQYKQCIVFPHWCAGV